MAIQENQDRLTYRDRQRLRDFELTIEEGQRAWLRMGCALMTIQDDRLYRDEYDSFKDYVTRRWGLDDSYACRLIGAARVALELGDDDIALNVAIALSRQTRSQARRTWRAARRLEGRRPTVRTIRRLSPTVKAGPGSMVAAAITSLSSLASTIEDLLADDTWAERLDKRKLALALDTIRRELEGAK